MGKAGKLWDRYVEYLNADDREEKRERKPPEALGHPAGLALTLITLAGAFLLLRAIGIADGDSAIQFGLAAVVAVGAYLGARRRRSARHERRLREKIRDADSRHARAGTPQRERVAR